MFFIKNNILYLIFLNILAQSNGLIELQDIEYNEIANTEAAIRKTVNSLFASLKLRGSKRKARFKEFSSIHNLFVSITLQDHYNLKEIAKHVKADTIDNSTQSFITLINEVLNEDNKSYETKEDVYVTTHIETFIKKLESLKSKYGFSDNSGKYDINSEILKHLDNNKIYNFLNITEDTKTVNETDNNVLSDDEFWQPSGRRIYDGHRVSVKRYPFVASVQFFKKFQCGGSIIKSDLVITSASCLQLAWNNRFFRENPAFLSVQVGCNFYQGCEENIPVIEVYFHPQYDPKTLRNNLAVMRLRRIIKFGKKVKKVKKIDFDRNPWSLPQTAGKITILGWGARSNANIMRDPWYDRLSVAELDFYPLRECQDVYSKEYVTNRNFCAGFFSKGGGACNRDVGGPGVIRGILMGVVSFGSPTCGAPDAPTVFTKLGFYTDWLEDILEKQVPVKKAPTTEKTTRDTMYRLDMITKTTSYRLYPITNSNGEEIIDEEALRTFAESALFKQFLDTMFNSNEVKDYLNEVELEGKQQKDDESEPETEADNESIKVTTTKTLIATRDAQRELKVKPTRATTKKVLQPNRVTPKAMVTEIENFDNLEADDDSMEATPAPVGTQKYTIIMDDVNMKPQEHQNNDDKKMEEEIAKLIEDIDIEVLSSDPKRISEKLERKDISDQSSSDSSEGSELSEVGGAGEVEEAEEESSERETSRSKDISSEAEESGEQLGIALGSNYEEPRKNNKRQSGLSIPTDAFKDFTFRQNNTAGFMSLFTNDELINLLSEAVAESQFLKGLA